MQSFQGLGVWLMALSSNSSIAKKENSFRKPGALEKQKDFLQSLSQIHACELKVFRLKI
jgi:hypothetical protein